MKTPIPNISAKTRIITPDEAVDILAAHENYRRPSFKRIQAYSREMKEGRWGLSSLVYDEEGRLTDGQHRLHALVDAETPQVFVELHGWPASERHCLDNGQNRSRAQVLKAEAGVSAGTLLGAIAGGMKHIGPGIRSVLNSEIVPLYQRNKTLLDEIEHRLKGRIRLAAIGVAFGRACIAHPEDKDSLLSALARLSDLDFHDEKMSGLRCLYKYAVESWGRNGRSQYDLYMRASRAIQGYLNNEKIGKLCVPKNDPFNVSESV